MAELDFSRPRLRELSHWIRNDLDPLLASEGPDKLQADDLLTLHDIFTALRTADTITALDCRATGIHRAVMDVSGVATRWPGPLADDCDKVISAWTAKFGKLTELHPFLYGRGGRLEGIASPDEYTKQSLINRWEKQCPERLNPKVSHRHGDLGFRAGEWWINPMFACYDGIIDLDSVEGGICYDKKGTYALLLKDTGELEAPKETTFTYRCGREDKGRFPLTAATPASRAPVRVLRSHSINSIWGPKAGVRYDGLYRVVGWVIHQMKVPGITSHEYRPGDVIYDIKFERDDPTPMEEVVKVPTACETDIYAEYKRLRKIHRDLQHKSPARQAKKPEVQQPARKAPQIAPLAPPHARPRSMSRASPPASRAPTSKHPVSHTVVSRTKREIPIEDPCFFENEDLFVLPPKSTLMVPPQRTVQPASQHRPAESPVSETVSHPPKLQGQTSAPSSSGTTKSHLSDIREVAPWIDYDIQLAMPSPGSQTPVVQHRHLSPGAKPGSRISEEGEDSPRAAHSNAKDNPSPRLRPEQKKIADEKKREVLLAPTALSQDPKRKESRKSIFHRGRTPISKHLDGADSPRTDSVGIKRMHTDSAGTHDNHSHRENQSRAASSSPMRAPEMTQHERESSFHGLPLSPTPFLPIPPASPLLLGRRDAICYPYGIFAENTPSTSEQHEGFISYALSTEDTAWASHEARLRRSLSSLLNGMITRPKASAGQCTPNHTSGGMSGFESNVHVHVRSLSEAMATHEANEESIVFKNPFEGKETKGGRSESRASTSNIAPDVV